MRAKRVLTIVSISFLAFAMEVRTAVQALGEPAREGRAGSKKKKKQNKAQKSEKQGGETTPKPDDNGESESRSGDRGDRERGEKSEEGAADQDKELGRVEAAKRKLAAEGRKSSEITPGSASRWSNRGAMTPIVSEVPITAPLPARAVPIAAGAETPGQGLLGGEELLEARLYFGAYHLATAGQDFVYQDTTMPGLVTRIPDRDRDIDLYRARATMAYERIAGSDFGAHLDLEYRARGSGSRPTDHRINELYLSYGLTDFRRRGGPDFGIAIGRVAVREAGYAEADGAALRLRLSPELNLGAFGGFTADPFHYNWRLERTEDFSTDWLRGGAYLAYRAGRIFTNVAGVVTYANIHDTEGGSDRTGVDRFYLYADVAYLALEDLNLFLTGWLDVVGGQAIQNVEAVAAYSPTDDLDLRLSLGRFSTFFYEKSTANAYSVDPANNRAPDSVTPNAPIVGEEGTPIVPYNAVYASAIYNSIRLRAGYRVVQAVELFALNTVLLRDTSNTDELLTAANTGATVPFASTRIVPGAGVRYKNPNILDANAQLSFIIDKQSQANAFLQAGVGRGFGGLYASLDGRTFFGEIPGSDGGIEVSYTFPREWFPGRLMLRGMLRYFRESVALERPDNPAMDFVSPGQLILIPTQESFLGFAGIEWRL